MRLYYNLTTIYDLPPTMSAEIIKLRERAKGLLTVRFGRPFVSLWMAPKHTTNSSLPKLMPQYVEALKTTTNLSRMQKLADAAETLRDRSKDPDTILARVLAVKTSVVPSVGNLIGRKKNPTQKSKGTPKGKAKKKQTPPPIPMTTAKTTAKDNAKIIVLEKEAKDCNEELKKVRKNLLTLQNEKASIDADNEKKKSKIKELEQQIADDKKKCDEELKKLKTKLEAAEKTNLESVPKEKVDRMKKDAVQEIEMKFKTKRETLEATIKTLKKAQTTSTASVNAKIESLMKEKGDLEKQKSTLEKELKKLRTELSTSQNDNSKLEESNRTLQGQKKALETAKTKLEGEKNQLANNLEQLRTDNSAALKKLKDNQKDELKKAKQPLKEEINALKKKSEKVIDLEKQLEKSTEQKKKLEKELEKAKKVFLEVSKNMTDKNLTIEQYDWDTFNLKTAFKNYKKRMADEVAREREKNGRLLNKIDEVEKVNKKLIFH